MDRKAVKIATVSLPHYGAEIADTLRAGSQEKLLEEGKIIIREAGLQRPDFIVLPELFGSFGVPEKIIARQALAECVPGKGRVFSFLQEQARKYNAHIVAGILEKDENRYFNSGIMLNRCGELVGKYRGVHLVSGEGDWIMAGDDFPVFHTEGVCCGMLICFDMNFPEAARCLALQGADVIFWPTMWGLPKDAAYYDAVLRARAGENLCFVVSSALVRGPEVGGPDAEVRGRSAIVSRRSEIIVEVGPKVGTATASVDLDEPICIQEIRANMLGKLRRPECYKIISKQQ